MVIGEVEVWWSSASFIDLFSHASAKIKVTGTDDSFRISVCM